MARKRRMKMPNGHGSIKYLGKNRRNPYGVYPPAERTAEGKLYTPKAIGYTETWEAAYELLTVYNMEKDGRIKSTPGTFIDRSPTFAEVYEGFYKEKFETNQSRKFSKASMDSTRAAFKNCSILHDKQVGLLRYKDLQEVVNNCPLAHSSLELIVSLLHQMYAYMIKYEIIETDHSKHLYIPIVDDDEQGEPFTESELQLLWDNKNDDTIQMLLIMCYSGFRITAYTKMEVNLEDRYFKGGVKTKTGKERIVPIHSAIYDLVCSRNQSNLLGCTTSEFRSRMYQKLSELHIDYTSNGKKHTPHDCRHTFSALCEHYKVNENDRKRMMGHSFGSDITNAKYGHRTVSELREEIEKIKLPEKPSIIKICC